MNQKLEFGKHDTQVSMWSKYSLPCQPDMSVYSKLGIYSTAIASKIIKPLHPAMLSNRTETLTENSVRNANPREKLTVP